MAKPATAWVPAGPKATAYGQSRADVAVIVGPTGGGKTTESVRRILRVAQWQHPSPIDGVRKARIGVIGTTYRRLWDQVIPSYFKEIDKAWGVVPGKSGFTGARGDPADHHFTVQFADGTHGYIEVLFRAVGDSDLEEFFRGMEVTAWWIPEMDTHESDDILAGASNRVGRYPEPDDRPAEALGLPNAYAGVWADSNAPVIGSWFHKRFYLKPEAGDAVFIQPSGLSPNAENLQNLRKINRDYYADLARKMAKPWAIRRFIENKPGYSRHGQPVHEHFDAERMIVRGGILAEPGTELLIGADTGNTLAPAAIFLQRHFRQVRAIAEVAPKTAMDIMEFAQEVRRIRETRFGNIKRVVLIVDPAAVSRSVLNRQLTFAQILQGATGIDVELAPTNDPKVRRTAVDQLLQRAGPPGEPGFLVGDDCPGLIEAMAGGYKFRRQGEKVSPTPEKNEHSHIADAFQYGVLGLEGVGMGMGGRDNPGDGYGGHAGGDQSPILQE